MTYRYDMYALLYIVGRQAKTKHTTQQANHLRNADRVDGVVSLGHGGRRSLGSEAAKPGVSALSARTSSCNLAVDARET